MTWSPFSADIMTDPANGHATLLQQCPVHCCNDFDPPFYTLSRYADVKTALRDIETFSSHFGQGPRFTEPLGMLCDPPQHTYIRRLVQQAFTPRAMQALTSTIQTVIERLIKDIHRGPDVFDFHDDFAFPLPVIIIAGLLGVPQSDLERFKHWSDIQVMAMGAEDPTEFETDQAAFYAYMQNHLDTRRQEIARNQQVPSDLLTLIANGKDDTGVQLRAADAQSVLMQLLVGGNETTTSLITNLLWRLLEHPDQWSELKNKPTLIDAAIEESLRFDPPVLGLYRHTTCDVTLHGVTIPSGNKVYINYAAANRDPRFFEHPDSFDITRERSRHMSFGLGTHFCLGAPMARLETEIAFKQLIQSLPDLELLGAGERIAPFFLWGRRKLPLKKR